MWVGKVTHPIIGVLPRIAVPPRSVFVQQLLCLNMYKNTPQAPVGAPPTYPGVLHQPYQGSRTSGWGQPYHPYQHAPVEARGRRHGRRGRGPEAYQMHEPPLPPNVAAPQCPVGSPPNDLHFADDSHEQGTDLTEPRLECWVTGHSHDSNPTETYTEYDYAPEAYYEDQDYDYYEGGEE